MDSRPQVCHRLLVSSRIARQASADRGPIVVLTAYQSCTLAAAVRRSFAVLKSARPVSAARGPLVILTDRTYASVAADSSRLTVGF